MKFSSIFRAAQVIKPHVPSIKFRRTQLDISHTSSPTVSKGVPTASGGTSIHIDERHLPIRFRRPILDEKEIGAINSGGAL